MYKVPQADREEQRTNRLRRFATPYSLWETLGVIKRNFTGVNTTRNQANISCAPQSINLHPNLTPHLKIGFIGDIMNLSTKSLSIGKDLRGYLSACDILIGNFEATICNHKKRDHVWTGTPQPQAERILDDLADIFEPSKFFLSLANNHSGDYSKSIFERSCQMIKDRGFPLFGMKDTPFIDLDDQVRLVTGTMWSNQFADDMLWLHDPENAKDFTKKGAVNILYVHWGYELEAYPRGFIVDQAQQYAKHYDAIIGHHGHNPQPVTVQNNIPILYGLGDFCYYYDLPTYRHGMVSRLEIGKTKNGIFKTKHIDWQMISNHHDGEKLEVKIDQNLLEWLHFSDL